MYCIIHSLLWWPETDQQAPPSNPKPDSFFNFKADRLKICLWHSKLPSRPNCAICYTSETQKWECFLHVLHSRSLLYSIATTTSGVSSSCHVKTHHMRGCGGGCILIRFVDNNKQKQKHRWTLNFGFVHTLFKSTFWNENLHQNDFNSISKK